MNKHFRFLIQCVIAGLLLSSCGSGQALPSPTPLSENRNRPVQLTIWIPEKEDVFYSRLIEDFELENPDTNLTIEEIPEAIYIEKVDTAVKSGAAPDIALVRAARWLKAGIFLPLDSAIQINRIPRNDFNPGAISKNCILDKVVYCLGTTTKSYILFYNLKFFDQAGVPYPLPSHPLSIAEFDASIRQIARKMDRSNEKFLGGAIPLPIWWMDPKTAFSPDGRRIDRFANDEASSAAFQLIANLIKEKSLVVYGLSSSAEAENIQRFANGELAVLIADSSLTLPVIADSGITWGAAVVPVENKTDPSWTSAWTDGFGVLRSSRKPEKAVLFVSYLALHGSQLRLNMNQIPLNMKIAAQWPANDESRSEVLQAAQAAQPGIFLPDNPFLPGSFNQALDQMVEKGIPAKKALDAVTPDMQAHLDQAWQIFDQIMPPPKQ